MTRRIVLGILIALVLVTGAVMVGVYAYQFGVVQGLAQSDQIQVVVPELEAGARVYPYHSGWRGSFFHQPFGFLGCFGFILPLLFIFLIFGLVRRMLWGGWGHRGWGHHGWRGEGVPPPFEEWHKRAHAQSGEAPKSE